MTLPNTPRAAIVTLYYRGWTVQRIANLAKCEPRDIERMLFVRVG